MYIICISYKNGLYVYIYIISLVYHIVIYTVYIYMYTVPCCLDEVAFQADISCLSHDPRNLPETRKLEKVTELRKS